MTFCSFNWLHRILTHKLLNLHNFTHHYYFLKIIFSHLFSLTFPDSFLRFLSHFSLTHGVVHPSHLVLPQLLLTSKCLNHAEGFVLHLKPSGVAPNVSKRPNLFWWAAARCLILLDILKILRGVQYNFEFEFEWIGSSTFIWFWWPA